MAVKYWHTITGGGNAHRLVNDSSKVLLQSAKNLASFSLNLLFFTRNERHDVVENIHA
jgi:hypothetical protein